VTESTISSGESKPHIFAVAGLTRRKRPSGVLWKIPMTAFSKRARYFSSLFHKSSWAFFFSVMSRAVKTTPAERSPGSMGVELRRTFTVLPSLRCQTVTMLPVPLHWISAYLCRPTRSNSSSLG